MNYILTTPAGEQMSFYILECAEIFQWAFGGDIKPVEIQHDFVETASTESVRKLDL